MCKPCLTIMEKAIGRPSDFRNFVRIFKGFTDYVYFIHATGTNAVKIGIADDPVKRLMSLQVGNHLELNLITCMRANPAIEKAFHERFKESNIRGEWFTISPEMLDLFEEIASNKKPACLESWSSTTDHLLETVKAFWATR